jgi:hypothetical protein
MITDSAGGGTGQLNESRTGRTEQLVEVSVFLFLIVPSMVFSFFVINQSGVGFVLTALSTIVRDLALVSLILFFIWRNRESVKKIGWAFKNGWIDIVLGIGLFFPLFYGAAMLESALRRQRPHFWPPRVHRRYYWPSSWLWSLLWQKRPSSVGISSYVSRPSRAARLRPCCCRP